MGNTRFNCVWPVAPVNEPTQRSPARGRDQGRCRERPRGIGRGKKTPTRNGATIDNSTRNKSHFAQHEEIEENEEVDNDKDILQDEEVHAETTRIPPLYPVLSQQIMLFVKTLVGLGVLLEVQETQDPANLLQTLT